MQSEIERDARAVSGGGVAASIISLSLYSYVVAVYQTIAGQLGR